MEIWCCLRWGRMLAYKSADKATFRLHALQQSTLPAAASGNCIVQHITQPSLGAACLRVHVRTAYPPVKVRSASLLAPEPSCIYLSLLLNDRFRHGDAAIQYIVLLLQQSGEFYCRDTPEHIACSWPSWRLTSPLHYALPVANQKVACPQISQLRRSPLFHREAISISWIACPCGEEAPALVTCACLGRLKHMFSAWIKYAIVSRAAGAGMHAFTPRSFDAHRMVLQVLNSSLAVAKAMYLCIGQ